MKQEMESATVDQSTWEYRQLTATPVDHLMMQLNQEARDGWELVCVTVEEPYYRAFLKRMKPLMPESAD